MTAQDSALDNLLTRFARLPGLGPRSARRLVLYLMQHQDTQLHPLLRALERAHTEIVHCTICHQLDTQTPCHICADTGRDKSLLCVVERQSDLWALERAKSFKGQYHVLGGTLNAMDGIGPDALNIASLRKRCEADTPTEIILAMNATLDGQTTAHYLMDMLQPLGVKLTHLAHGVPMGGELDYLDAGTLELALNARKPF